MFRWGGVNGLPLGSSFNGLPNGGMPDREIAWPATTTSGLVDELPAHGIAAHVHGTGCPVMANCHEVSFQPVEYFSVSHV
jgi:hypothetical protein